MKIVRVTRMVALALALCVLRPALSTDLMPWPVDAVQHEVSLWHEGAHHEWVKDESDETVVRARLNEACKSEKFIAVTKVDGLPRQLQNRITSAASVADFGRPWEATDVAGPEHLPYRRLAVSALGRERAFVAIEHGGGPNYVELWAFARTGAGWDGRQMGSVSGSPQSLSELLYEVCDGFPKPGPRPSTVEVPLVE